MWEKIRKIMQQFCDVLEFAVALVVGLALAFTVVSYIPGIFQLLSPSTDTTHFLIFLEEIFNLVVGIEFMKMLCKPSAGNVIEVLVFLVARHMIIGTNSALDMLFSILSIAILYLIRMFLRIGRDGQAGLDEWPKQKNETRVQKMTGQQDEDGKKREIE